MTPLSETRQRLLHDLRSLGTIPCGADHNPQIEQRARKVRVVVRSRLAPDRDSLAIVADGLLDLARMGAPS